MIAVNSKVLVSCDLNQKDKVLIGSVEFKTANNYEHNYRVKSPVIATVLEGNEILNEGDNLLCHHNLFYAPSPFRLYDNLFSIPFSKVLFAKILANGDLLPICGNILGERIGKKYDFEMPPDKKEKYSDRILVTNAGYTKYKNGQILLTRPYAPYDIVYIFNGEQKVATKISEDMVTGILWQKY